MKRFNSFITTKETYCSGCGLRRIPALRMSKGRVSLLFLCAECIESDERVLAVRRDFHVVADYTPERFGFSFAPTVPDERRHRVIALLALR